MKNIFIPLSLVLLGCSACDMTVAANGNQNADKMIVTNQKIEYVRTRYDETVQALKDEHNDAQLRNKITNHLLPGAGQTLYVSRNTPQNLTESRPPFDAQRGQDPVAVGDFIKVDLVTYAMFHHTLGGDLIRRIPDLMLDRALDVTDADLRLNLVEEVVRHLDAAGIRALWNRQVPVRLYNNSTRKYDVVNVSVRAARSLLYILNGNDEDQAYLLLRHLGLNNDADLRAINRELWEINNHGTLYGDVFEAIEFLEMIANNNGIKLD